MIMRLPYVFLSVIISVTLVGILPALAIDTSDSSTWKTANNYASVAVRVTDCTPYGGNSSNDGICDNWKINSGPNAGLHINFTDTSQGATPVTYLYNLSCVPGNTIANDPTGLTVCPSPNKKDVYVEVDWMTGQGPDPQAIADVVKAFDKQGIALHVQSGENPTVNSGDIGVHYCDVRMLLKNYPATAGKTCTPTSTNYQSYPYLKQNFFGTASERSGDLTACPSNAMPTNAGSVKNPNSYNCLTAKRQVFHYAMYVNYQFGNTVSSGWSEIIGNDFLISLGNFENNGVGTIDEQEGAFMHELGHNFGLHHGGDASVTGNDDDQNCKPNYLSVMSYTYEFRKTADICRPLDYSGSALSSLNEQSLSDSNVGSYPYPSDNPAPPAGTTSNPTNACPTSGERPIWWSTPNNGIQTSSTTGQTTDWDINGIDNNTYSQTINNMGVTGCSSSTLSTLDGFNDWDFILNGNNNGVSPLNFRSSTNFYQGIIAEDRSDEIGTGVISNETVPTSFPNHGGSHVDAISPTVTVPQNIVVTAPDSNGATVNYPAPTATDDIAVTSGPTCSPSSGSVFPIGTTTVTCTANDATGNVGTATFIVTVTSPPPPPPYWAYGAAAVIIAIATAAGLYSARKK